MVLKSEILPLENHFQKGNKVQILNIKIFFIIFIFIIILLLFYYYIKIIKKNINPTPKL